MCFMSHPEFVNFAALNAILENYEITIYLLKGFLETHAFYFVISLYQYRFFDDGPIDTW